MKNTLGKQRKLHVSQTLLTTYPDKNIYKNLNFGSRQAWHNGFNMGARAKDPRHLGVAGGMVPGKCLNF